MNSRGTIHIVDDDEAISKSLKLFLKSCDYTTRNYASAEYFIDTYSKSEGPECILLDVRLPGLKGVELLEILPEKNIKEPVVMMTGHGDVTTAVRAMKAGAVDFIEKPFDHDELISILNICLECSTAKQAMPGNKFTAQKLNLLTRRERQVFDQLVDGKINKVIAAELNVSVRTVEAHRASIMHKLHTKSLSDLVKISFNTQAT